MIGKNFFSRCKVGIFEIRASAFLRKKATKKALGNAYTYGSRYARLMLRISNAPAPPVEKVLGKRRVK